jgi:hypothetical protein
MGSVDTGVMNCHSQQDRKNLQAELAHLKVVPNDHIT